MNFKLYETIVTYKAICPRCNQHFTIKYLTNIICKNCDNKGDINV